MSVLWKERSKPCCDYLNNCHTECKNEAAKWSDYKSNHAVAKPYLCLYFVITLWWKIEKFRWMMLHFKFPHLVFLRYRILSACHDWHFQERQSTGVPEASGPWTSTRYKRLSPVQWRKFLDKKKNDGKYRRHPKGPVYKHHPPMNLTSKRLILRSQPQIHIHLFKGVFLMGFNRISMQRCPKLPQSNHSHALSRSH